MERAHPRVQAPERIHLEARRPAGWRSRGKACARYVAFTLGALPEADLAESDRVRAPGVILPACRTVTAGLIRTGDTFMPLPVAQGHSFSAIAFAGAAIAANLAGRFWNGGRHVLCCRAAAHCRSQCRGLAAFANSPVSGPVSEEVVERVCRRLLARSDRRWSGASAFRRSGLRECIVGADVTGHRHCGYSGAARRARAS